MPTPFAALEASVNRACAAHLANAEMVCAGGTVAVVFGKRDMDYGTPKGVPSQAREWIASAPEADFAAVSPKHGDAVMIAGQPYTLAEDDTDATAWTTWTLRPA